MKSFFYQFFVGVILFFIGTVRWICGEQVMDQ